MSKVTAQHHEAVENSDAQSSSHQNPTHDNGRAPRDTVFDSVEHFANVNGLKHHVNVLQKAALLVRGETALDDIALSALELQSLRDETNRKWSHPKMLYYTILVCS